MKTRQGFVSNSSSSSFVFLGYKINSKDITIDFLKKHLNLTDEELENDYGNYICCGKDIDWNVNFCPKCGKAQKDMEIIYHVNDIISELAEELSIDGLTLFNPFGDDMYFGKHVGSIYTELIDRSAFIKTIGLFKKNIADPDAWLIKNLQLLSGETYDG